MSRTPKSGGDDDPAPTAPAPPDDEACCGQGCDPCVFDLYAAAQQRYLTELRAWQERQYARKPGRKPSKRKEAAR